MGRQVSKFSAAKRDPLLQGMPGLSFDNLGSGEELVLTEAQKATAFLSRYLDVIDPFETYREYFASSAKGEGWDMRDVKTQYTKLVTHGRWSEEKYVAVINDIFENGAAFTPITLDIRGRMYEQGQLASQQRQKSSRRRRG